MANVLVEKQVLFSGIWLPRFSADDAFFRTVSQEFQDKPGAKPALWRLTTEGLTILAQRTTSDQIPVQALKEVTVNRYNPLCLVTLFVDTARRFNALVCRCQNEQDAAHIVQVFRHFQKSLSGEGYRIDLKQPKGINWTLKPRQNGERGDDEEDHAGSLNQGSVNQGSLSLAQQHHLHKNGERVTTVYTQRHHSNSSNSSSNNNNNPGEVTVLVEEEMLEREAIDVGGRACFNVGVQADLPAEDDNVSITSEMSYQSLKDELEVLSSEVRDIKILLEQTTGISAEEFFRRRRDQKATRLVPVKRHLSQDIEGSHSRNGEKSVNFADLPPTVARDGWLEEEDEDFDIRSVGMQTSDTRSQRGKYVKRVRQGLTPSRYQTRSRGDSSSSSQSSSPGAVMSPVSPFSPNTHGGDGSVFFGSSSQRHDFYRDPRLLSSSLSRGATLYSSGGTVIRPIESVYQAPGPGFRQRRRQVVVLPTRSASMPRQHRTFSRPPQPAPASAHKILTAKTSSGSAANGSS